jgi:hypothetical protein
VNAIDQSGAGDKPVTVTIGYAAADFGCAVVKLDCAANLRIAAELRGARLGDVVGVGLPGDNGKRSNAVGAFGTTVSTVTETASEFTLGLPAISVIWAVTLNVPWPWRLIVPKGTVTVAPVVPEPALSARSV